MSNVNYRENVLFLSTTSAYEAAGAACRGENEVVVELDMLEWDQHDR